MQQDDFTQPLMNALPPAVVALALAIFSVEAILFLGGHGLVGGPDAIGWRTAAVQDWSVFPPLVQWLVSTSRWTSPEMVRFISYPFVHWNFTHGLPGGTGSARERPPDHGRSRRRPRAQPRHEA